jgi:ComF family protein
MLQFIKKNADLLLETIYPKTCIGCDTIVKKTNLDLCTKCLAKLPETDYHEDRNNFFYDKMSKRFNIFQAASLYFFSKENAVHDLIHHIKYKDRSDLAYEFGRYYGNILKSSDNFVIPDILVPVPIHYLKRIKRGYNQSEFLANGIAEGLGITMIEKGLTKIENNTSQTNKSMLKRLKNVEEMFDCEPNIFDNKHIGLIDDVMTTGATISACVDAILENNINTKVTILTLSIVKY